MLLCPGALEATLWAHQVQMQLMDWCDMPKVTLHSLLGHELELSCQWPQLYASSMSAFTYASISKEAGIMRLN